MFLKGKVKQKSKEHYYTLKYITEIGPKNVESNPKWAKLKDQYEEIESDPEYDWPAYAITTFCNSILTQERVYFILGRDSFAPTIRKDTNWKNKIGFSNDKWNTFKDYLEGKKGGHAYIELYKDGDNNTKIYKVIDKDLLNLLKVDEEKQLKECIIAAKTNDEKKCKNNNLETDGLVDGLADEVVSNKVVSSKYKVESDANADTISNQDYNIDLSMPLLFREEFGINNKTEWSEIHDMIPMLASYAVENLGLDSCTKRDFLNYLLELNNGKKFETKSNKYTGWSQKKFADLLADNFEKAVESYVYHAKKENKQLEIVKPKDVVKNTIPIVKIDKKERDRLKEQAGQQNTVEILKTSFVGPSIEALNRQLAKAKGNIELERQIRNEIKMIERVCYGN